MTTTKERLDQLEHQYREWCKRTYRASDDFDSFCSWEGVKVLHSTARTMQEIDSLRLRLFPRVDG